MAAKLPRNGSEVKTPDGKGTVTETNALKQTVKVKVYIDENNVDLKEYPLADIKILRQGKRQQQKEEVVIDDEMKSLLED